MANLIVIRHLLEENFYNKHKKQLATLKIVSKKYKMLA